MNDAPRQNASDLPEAVIRSKGTLFRVLGNGGWMWIVTGLCLIVAVVLTWRAQTSQGPVITINFQQGHGIKAGDTLRHLGIEVGLVRSVELASDLRSVRVVIELQQNAADLAREGSRFWIVRPQLSLTRMQGLETIVGAKYLAVLPGSKEAPQATRFVGLENPLSLSDSGLDEIIIQFDHGFGLSAGDPVRYRGITVGEVMAVQLHPDLTQVTATVRLVDTARTLARAGTLFWVERPRVSVQEIRGLDTLVSGRHLALLPGPEEAARQTRFQGLDVAPTGEMPEGGLEIILFGPQLRGLQRGAPVLYRGVRVGHIVTVGLSSDATSVEARAYVRPAYRQLVRSNSVFWNESGIDFSLGFTGVDFNSEALANVATGGVAMATPDPAGSQIKTGARFRLLEEMDAAAAQAQPHIPVGSHALAEGTRLPQLVRASLTWREKRLGISRKRQRNAWVLPLSDQQLLAARQFLLPPDSALDGKATLALAGKDTEVDRKKLEQSRDVTVIRLSEPLDSDTRWWPAEAIRSPAQIEACLLVRDDAAAAFPITPNRLQVDQGSWVVDASVSLDEDWSGAAAVSTIDGKVLGVTQVEKGRVRIALYKP